MITIQVHLITRLTASTDGSPGEAYQCHPITDGSAVARYSVTRPLINCHSLIGHPGSNSIGAAASRQETAGNYPCWFSDTESVAIAWWERLNEVTSLKLPLAAKLHRLNFPPLITSQRECTFFGQTGHRRKLSSGRNGKWTHCCNRKLWISNVARVSWSLGWRTAMLMVKRENRSLKSRS